MIIFPQTLTRAVSSPGVGIRPEFVLGLALLRGTRLTDKLVFDRSANVLFEDPEIGFKMYGSVHGPLDLLNDSFHLEQNCVGLELDDFFLIASKVGDYTLVAVNQPGANFYLGKPWIEGLARALLSAGV